MVKIYEPQTSQALSLSEFFSSLDTLDHEPLSDAYLADCATRLYALSLDPWLLRRHLDNCGGLAGVRSSLLPPQSLLLGKNERFALRANVWLPLSMQRAFHALESDLYAYKFAHNHDFRFLTVGYFGPGYVTDLYEIDAASVRSTPGHPVTVVASSRQTLSPGKVIYFEPLRDVHVQYPPSGLSISLNLLFLNERFAGDQCVFDLERSCVIGPALEGAVGRMLTCIELAAAFPDERTPSTLRQLALDCPSESVRAFARETLARMELQRSAASR